MAEFASRSTAIGGLTTGIIGTALGVLNGGAGLLGMMPNAQVNNGGGYVTKDMLDLSMKLAAKDSELALVKSEQNTEIKIADVYERVMTKVNANQREQDAINRDQAVYNATNTATVSVLGSQVADLRAVLAGITVTHIPAEKVCPEPMAKYNSWTAPTT